MPTGSTISRTDAAAKPRCANARAASSSSRGRRPAAPPPEAAGRKRCIATDSATAGRMAALERQTIVWSTPHDARLRGGPAPPAGGAAGAENRRMSTPSAAAQLRERARAPDALERADIPWLHTLEVNEQERALAALKVVRVGP